MKAKPSKPTFSAGPLFKCLTGIQGLETEAELKADGASLGFDLAGLVRQKKILVDYIHIEPGEIPESGRPFRWLKVKGVTAVIAAERGRGLDLRAAS
jgi:hypothetical protein